MRTTTLTRQYQLAIGLVAVLSIISFLTLQQLIKTQLTAADVVNVSGRQRMLSEKIALTGLALIHAADDAERDSLRSELKVASKLMNDSANALFYGGTVTSPPESHVLPELRSEDIRSIYLEKPTLLREQTKNYLSHADSLVAADSSELRPGNTHATALQKTAPALLTSFNRVVAAHAAKSRRDIEQLRYIALGILLVTLTALLLICYLVFRPTVDLVEEEAKELEKANRQLYRLSSIDGLTGVANRRNFDEFLENEWRRGLRDSAPVTVIMADIDFFKAFNDSLGHQAGDECLKAIAAVIAEALKRPGDLVARYGGEEFVAVLPGTELTGGREVAETLRARVEEIGIAHPASEIGPTTTISLGVACVVPDKSTSPRDLVHQADQSLYLAKAGGRNRVVAFEEKGIKT